MEPDVAASAEVRRFRRGPVPLAAIVDDVRFGERVDHPLNQFERNAVGVHTDDRQAIALNAPIDFEYDIVVTFEHFDVFMFHQHLLQKHNAAEGDAKIVRAVGHPKASPKVPGNCG